LGKKRLLVGLPPWLAYPLTNPVGWLVRDVMLTREEVRGLMGNLLYVDAPPAGETKLSQWMQEHADELGVSYASEMSRRLDRTKEY
jgi:NADH dehydrogenase